jgi:cholesterol transport system auxiliary component
MNIIAAYDYHTWARGLFISFFMALTGCALPSAPDRPAVYDFGPGPRQMAATDRTAELAPLSLAELETHPALDTPAMLYRLVYGDAQQLRPYALARWSMTPAQLVHQRLREQLGQRRAVLAAGDNGPPGAATPPTLRIELEEFSQLFETPGQSVGLLRLRATLVQPGSSGERLIAQRSVIVQRPAATADAAGGVRALTAAVDAAVLEIEQWLARMPF